MQSYKYILEPYKGMNSRYRCPECNKGKTFSRYIDTETGEHIADHVGRCNRVDNCGNHYTPKQYFQEMEKLKILKKYRLFVLIIAENIPKSYVWIFPNSHSSPFIYRNFFNQTVTSLVSLTEDRKAGLDFVINHFYIYFDKKISSQIPYDT